MKKKNHHALAHPDSSTFIPRARLPRNFLSIQRRAQFDYRFVPYTFCCQANIYNTHAHVCTTKRSAFSAAPYTIIRVIQPSSRNSASRRIKSARGIRTMRATTMFFSRRAREPVSSENGHAHCAVRRDPAFRGEYERAGWLGLVFFFWVGECVCMSVRIIR